MGINPSGKPIEVSQPLTDKSVPASKMSHFRIHFHSKIALPHGAAFNSFTAVKATYWTRKEEAALLSHQLRQPIFQRNRGMDQIQSHTFSSICLLQAVVPKSRFTKGILQFPIFVSLAKGKSCTCISVSPQSLTLPGASNPHWMKVTGLTSISYIKVKI